MRNFRIVIIFTFVIVLGAIGCVGPPGPMGPPGPPGIAAYEVVVGETTVNSTAQKQLRVDCPEGKKALGAGWSVLDPTSAILDGRVTYFQPAFDGSHWLVNAQNKSAFAPAWKLRVRVICANVGS
jgi:hypothetical protein